MAERINSGKGGGSDFFLLRPLRRICMISAAVGGIGIFLASLAVTLSVLMRNFGLAGIRGDFELVELACVACGSLFLPLCQMDKGHVLVDLFTIWMKPKTQQRIDGIWMLLFAAAWLFIGWRLMIGLGDLRAYGDKTMLLRAPIWWAYVPAVFATVLSSLAALATGIQMVFAPKSSHSGEAA